MYHWLVTSYGGVIIGDLKYQKAGDHNTNNNSPYESASEILSLLIFFNLSKAP